MIDLMLTYDTKVSKYAIWRLSLRGAFMDCAIDHVEGLLRMDRRFKPLTGVQQLDVRRALLDDIEGHPSRPVPDVVRLVRTTLRLTIAEYAKICGVSARGLQDIERGVKSPTLETVAKLLKPMGLRLGVLTRETVEQAELVVETRSS